MNKERRQTLKMSYSLEGLWKLEKQTNKQTHLNAVPLCICDQLILEARLQKFQLTFQ